MSPPAAGLASAALGQFHTMPADFAHYVIDAATAAGILGVTPDQVAGLAAGVLPHATGPGAGLRYDYADLINLALFGGGSSQSIPDLALRFLLRFAAAGPDSWYAPRQWLVRVRIPESAAADGAASGRLEVSSADLHGPGIELLSADYVAATAPKLPKGTVPPPGYEVAVRLTGAPGTVRSAAANRVYAGVLEPLLSGAVIYQSVTEELRMRQQAAWALGMADCVVISRLLAERMREAGLTARARRGFLLGLVGSDHAWCEVFEDQRWKPMDAVFEFLASGNAGIRSIRAAPGFAPACRGGRFNRLLPCQADEASAIIRLDGQPAPPWWTSAISATSWEA